MSFFQNLSGLCGGMFDFSILCIIGFLFFWKDETVLYLNDYIQLGIVIGITPLLGLFLYVSGNLNCNEFLFGVILTGILIFILCLTITIFLKIEDKKIYKEKTDSNQKN